MIRTRNSSLFYLYIIGLIHFYGKNILINVIIFLRGKEKMIHNYLDLFLDEDYPDFIDKYLNTKTLNRIKNVTYFCGCDYTKLYNPLFLYTRFDHSLVVAHMTWHFTHDKLETIAALLHDVGTPCFAHCIDYVFGDYMNQESSEKEIPDMIDKDKELLDYLNEDGITLENLAKLEQFPILENKSPQLCADRLDGVLSLAIFGFILIR